MPQTEYSLMRDCEDDLWWYRALHRYLTNILSAYECAGTAALDVGCGTGGFLEQLDRLGFVPQGIDISEEAVRHAQERGYRQVLVGDANCFPLPDNSFDLVTCIDLLESESIVPEKTIEESIRVLKAGGLGLFQMPAHRWMSSRHDAAFNYVRRYNLKQFKRLFDRPEAEIIYTTYLFFTLFPLMAFWKLLHRGGKRAGKGKGDFHLPPKPVNEMLHRICKAEARLVPRVSLPQGTSVCILIRKSVNI